MRKPTVKNKYNLKPKDITHATVLDENRLREKPFWRNDVVNAWCLSDGCGVGFYGDYINSYWVGFYDEGRIKLMCSACEDMCNYDFKTFFNPNDIENEYDLCLQEKLLERINWLLDEKIIQIKR